MQKKYIDLHIHTTFSDGLLSPEKVVEIAKDRELVAIAIADHDTVAGFEQAKKKGNEIGIEVIPAVELSASYEGEDFHILGYLIEYDNPEFSKKIELFRNERLQRGEKMVDKLNELGVNITMDTVKSIAGRGSVGRPHLADALVKEEFVRTYDEAFARYLGYHAPAYVPKKYLTPIEAIELIHLVRGIAVLAHPGTSKSDYVIPDFIQMGIDGLEAYHSQYSKGIVEHYINLSKKFGLIYTGGSDCHGRGYNKILIGTPKVPFSCLESLEKMKRERYEKR